MTSDPQSETPSKPSRKRVDPFVGTVLDDRFEIEEVLGSGGMSVVYKAKQLRVNRHVAVKTLRMQLDSKPIYRERFQNEINLLCALSHPNIVTVYDCVIGADDQPYVIMDYLRGRSLEVLIGQEGPISVDRFLRIAVQVCGALDHAHRKGVIHRDLKPGNIVLMDDESDFVKVVDFGLAKLNDTNRRLTQSGELWGSPPYMSPEHCQSKPEDERSDLYSFGAVMYEMLTGKDPFHFATSVYELIQIHINTQPPSLAEANPLVHVPAQLEAVIFKTMEKRPEDRYQTAAELRDALVAVSSTVGANNSGDLLALPAAGKSRSSSTGEIIPAPGANFSPNPAHSATPSEHFRRALDPMRGINVDELFDGTANSAQMSAPAQPGIASNHSAPNQNYGSASNQNNGTASNQGNTAVSNQNQHALDSSTSHSNNSIRRMQSDSTAVFTPARIAALAAFVVCALAAIAIPNLMHQSNQSSPSKPNSVSTQAAGANQSKSSQTGTDAQPETTESALPSSERSAAAHTTIPHETIMHETTSHTPTAASTAHAQSSAPTTHTSSAAPTTHVTNSHASAHMTSPHPTSHPAAPHAANAHFAASHPSNSHPASAAKSSNPWDALQGLRKGK